MLPQSTFKVVEGVNRSCLVDLNGLMDEPHSVVVLGLISSDRLLLNFFVLFLNQMAMLLSLF